VDGEGKEDGLIINKGNNLRYVEVWVYW